MYKRILFSWNFTGFLGYVYFAIHRPCDESFAAL